MSLLPPKRTFFTAPVIGVGAHRQAIAAGNSPIHLETPACGCAFSKAPHGLPWADRQTRPICRFRVSGRSIPARYYIPPEGPAAETIRVECPSVVPINLSGLRIDFQPDLLADGQPLFNVHFAFVRRLFRHRRAPFGRRGEIVAIPARDPLKSRSYAGDIMRE